jgi:hypothetical protein
MSLAPSTYFIMHIKCKCQLFKYMGGPRGRDRMVVGFTTTYAISAGSPLMS